MVQVTRTTEGLRDILFNEMERFLAGEVDDVHVGAVTKITSSIIKTVVIDLEAKKMVERINEGRDQKKEISDLNLNLMLSSEVV